MSITVPVSLGELLDKISILLIKKINIKDQKKLTYITKELNQLNDILEKSNVDKNKITSFLEELKLINLKLWTIEDKIREHEKDKNFGKSFIDLARSVYINNDERAKIKMKINEIFDSEIIEVKSYKDYK